MLDSPSALLVAAGLVLAHLVGLLTAVDALMSTRTSQGTVAWILSLIFAPWLAVPLYWVFGHSRFRGYLVARRGGDSTLRDLLEHPTQAVEPFRTALRESQGSLLALERLARLPTVGGNRTEILRDGPSTFESIFQGLDAATSHALVQFYIVRDDEMGRQLSDALIRCAERGVKVFFLADRVGSHALPDSYLDRLRNSGIRAEYFSSLRRRPARLQINFRNHRKTVVVDGRVGWTGGINVGEEYLGSAAGKDSWRDTHVRVQGPAALGLQLAFLEDWFWATEDVPALEWTPAPPDPGEASGLGDPGDEPVLVIPSGPADPVDTASLMMQLAIHSANRRVWIASPYFVPDQGVQDALRLAVFRGVDVRILIPQRADSRLVELAGFAFFEDLLRTGVRIFRYREGFLHCKVSVVDEVAGSVGTVNLDNRSLRLNFELTVVLFGEASIAELAQHFEEDFADSTELTIADVTGRSLSSRIASQVVYLFAPLL